MSEETAQIYNHARRSGVSSVEAWEDLEILANEVSWDVERMLSEQDANSDAISDRELPR